MDSRADAFRQFDCELRGAGLPIDVFPQDDGRESRRRTQRVRIDCRVVAQPISPPRQSLRVDAEFRRQ